MRNWANWSDRRMGWATFIAVALIYVPTASLVHVWNSDVQAAVLPAIQMARTGLPWLDGLDLLGNPFFIESGTHVVSNRPIAISALAVPVYALFGAPYAVWPSAVAAALATAAAVTFMHLGIRRLVPPGAALAVTVVFAFGTPTWTVSADGLWGHTVTQLSISAAIFAASRDRWWLVGLALGLGILGRPHLAVIPLLVGLFVGYQARSLKPVVAVGIPSVLGAGALLWVNRWLYNDTVVSGYPSYPAENLTQADAWTLTDSIVNVLGFLVAPNRGLFIWTPVLLVLLPAAWRARRVAPPWVIGFVLGGIAYSAVQLRINWFHGVDTFYGYRHGLELLTCIVPLYALAWGSALSPRLRAVTAFFVALQVPAMTLGALVPHGFIGQAFVWTDNSFVWALRQHPAMLVLGSVLLLLLATRVALDVYKASTEAEEKTGTGRPAPSTKD